MATQYEAVLETISPYSQSRFVGDLMVDPESGKKLSSSQQGEWDDHNWQCKLHTPSSTNIDADITERKPDSDEPVFIPRACVKKALELAAKYMGRIPNEGKATYTKHFLTGVIELGAECDLRVSDFRPEPLMVSSTGDREGGKRVKRTFPTRTAPFKIRVKLLVVDKMVTEDALRQAFEVAGNQIGLGMHRPQNGGYKGRFQLVSLKKIG